MVKSELKMSATKRFVFVAVQHRKILLLNMEFTTKVNDSRNRVIDHNGP